MRKFLIGLTAVSALALTSVTAVLVADPTFASISTPANGANISGNTTFTATGTGSNSGCAILNDTSSTTIQLLNGSTVLASASNSEGFGNSGAPSASFTYETELSANGAYTVNDVEHFYPTLGFFTCSQHSSTFTNTVHIDNLSTIAYTGATTGAPGQSVTLAAQIGENGGNHVVPPAGQTVTFTVPGQTGTFSGSTNSSGLATVNVTLQGTPRTATVTASYAAQYYAASSTTANLVIGRDPTNVVVGTGGSAVFGQTQTLTATVSSAIGSNPNGPPTGTVQFQANGTNLGGQLTLNNGQATLNESSLDAGPYTITAVYSGDGNYLGNSGSAPLSISAASTKTVLTANPTSAVFGQAVNFTATVSTVAPGSGTPTGNVAFEENGQPLGSPVPLVNGMASSGLLTLGDANGYSIEAIFQGSTDFATSDATMTYTVGKAMTSTTVNSSTSTESVFGQSVQFTANVAAVSPGAGTPGGSVDFVIEGTTAGSTDFNTPTDLGPVTLSGGSATSAAESTLQPGSYTITATYGGNGDFLGSSSTVTQVVDPAQTTTSLGSSANPSVYGQPVDLTATVAPVAPGAGTPAGEIDFQVQLTSGGPVTDLGEVAIGTNGASIALPTEPAGTYTITATCEPTGADFAASSTTLSQVVNPDPTTTVVASSVNPSVFGQPVTFTAAVTANTPGSGTPTGSVTFFDGSTEIGSGPLAVDVNGDEASITTGSLSVATHAISAVYSGSQNFVTSTGDLTQTVNPDQTATTITQNGQATQGQSVSFTATVSPVAPGAGTPTGTVTFELNGAPFGGPVGLLQGTGGDQATSLPVSGLTPGAYTITAVYSGDTDFLSSTGSGVQAVGPADTTTTLVAGPNPAAYGQAVTLTTTVAVQPPGAGTPTGTVDFYDGTNLIGSALLSGGQASIAVSTLPAGPHSLSAAYVGEADFGPSTSNPDSETVQGDPTTTALRSAPNPSVFNSPVTLTATVTPNLPNASHPTGTVQFFNGSTLLGAASVAVVNQQATASLTLSTLPAGSDPLTAVYSGGGPFQGSTSAAATQTVNREPTSIATSKSGSTLFATLSTAQGPLAGQTLVISSHGATICSATTNSAGTISCSDSSQAVNVLLYGWTVNYAGSASYLPSSASG